MKIITLSLLSLLLTVHLLPARKSFQDGVDILNQPVGKIKGYDLVYDEYDHRDGYTGSVTVSYTTKQKKKQLFDLALGDFYLGGVQLLHLKKHDFIYVSTSHTYGHSQGYLYYLDTHKMKASQIKIKANNHYKLPDSLYVYRYFDLSLTENKTFTSSASVRSYKSNYRGFMESAYQLKQTKSGVFFLQAGKTELNQTDG